MSWLLDPPLAARLVGAGLLLASTAAAVTGKPTPIRALIAATGFTFGAPLALGVLPGGALLVLGVTGMRRMLRNRGWDPLYAARTREGVSLAVRNRVTGETVQIDQELK